MGSALPSNRRPDRSISGRQRRRVATTPKSWRLRSAGYDAQGSTLATTLEPCSHVGRTGACVEAIIKAGVSRVVVGVIDPDQQVDGTGVDRLRAAGIDVVVGIRAVEAAEQLAPYLHHRRTGRPYVVVKLAATVDGRTAAPDASSKWITGVEARTDGHRLRAESQAILVGSGTIRSDDPALTTRMVDGPNPRRIVLGSAPPDARVHPCLEWRGEIGGLLDLLGQEGVLQLMIEGGPNTIAQFHRRTSRQPVRLVPGTGDLRWQRRQTDVLR